MAMLNEIKPECEDREMLVPLTESLYVPGKIKVSAAPQHRAVAQEKTTQCVSHLRMRTRCW